MPNATRSSKEIARQDLERLAQIAEVDLAGYFERNPNRHPLKRKVIAVALCQGAALHYVDATNGVKDFDVYTFFARDRVATYPPRVRRIADFGSPRFGTSADRPDFTGRQVDLMGRSLDVDPGCAPREALRAYLSEGRSATARFLAQKAIVLLRPHRSLGVVVWAVERS